MDDAALICRVPGDVGGLSRMIESPAVWSERRIDMPRGGD